MLNYPGDSQAKQILVRMRKSLEDYEVHGASKIHSVRINIKMGLYNLNS